MPHLLVAHRKNSGKGRPGVVLVAVLIVVTLLALAAYQYSDLMMAEYRDADNAFRTAQARALAESGVHYAAAMLGNPDNFQNRLGGNPFDNPEAFQDVPVEGAEGVVGRFSITSAAAMENGTTDGNVRFGVSDEAGKINLNGLLQSNRKGDLIYDALMQLPNMADDIASAVADWLDADSQPRDGGAENDYYTGQTPTYRCKNGPLDSLEELLLVRGMTPDLLFGNDRNRNGQVDPGEEDGSGVFNPGLSAFLTIYSREQNVDPDGQPRIYLNDSDLANLYEKMLTEVGTDMANFIILYRQYGASSSGGSSFMGSIASVLRGKSSSSSSNTEIALLSSVTRERLKLNEKAKKKVSSIFDLVNTSVTIQGKDKKSPSTVFLSPLNDPGVQRDLLPKLFLKTTTEQKSTIPAKVNVNTAPRDVLLAIPNWTETEVDQLLAVRPALSSTDWNSDTYKTLTWLLTEANLPTSTLKKVEKYLTAQTQVYRLMVTAQLETRGPTARIEAVIDTNNGRPRILYWRDLTELGASP